MSQEVIEVTEKDIEIVEIVQSGPVGPAGPQANINYTVVSSPQTLSNSQNIAADTSGGSFTLTLPANPNAGDSIDIFDYSETFDTNPLTIARNGENIESIAEDLICNVEGAYFTMIYTGSTRGWQILPRYGTSGDGGGGALTTQGDMLYRGAAVNERLPIGTAGQVLKVNSGATAPEWGNAPDSIDDYTVVTTSQAIVNGARIAANTTSGAFTLNLPATPSDGDTVYILDFASTFDTNNLTLGRNGSNIEGLAEDMVCNVEGSSFKMVYTGATSGWQMIPYYGTGVAIGSNATDVLSLSSGQIVADDPAADRLVFWDDSESKLTYLQAGSGLTISGTTISASGGDTVSIDASAADILTATSGAISADDAGSDKIVFWDDSEDKLAYGSVGDVGAAAASHTHAASDVTSGTFDNARINFASPAAIGSGVPAAGTFTTLNANNGTVTTLQPALTVAQTWNDTGTAFRAFTLEATTVAAPNTALLAEFLHDGVSRFRFTPAGTLDVTSNGGFNAGLAGINISNGGNFRMNNSIELHTVAGGILEQRRGTNAQTFNIYNTYTDATNYERGFLKWDSNVFQIGTEEGSGGGTARNLTVVVDGFEMAQFYRNNTAGIPNGLWMASGLRMGFLNRGSIFWPTAGGAVIWNSAETDFTLLRFGGTTSSFPALKRNTTSLQVKLADDSAFTAIQGKLTTETVYTAGAPTATGYLVLYDSNGTAYKVPAEAL